MHVRIKIVKYALYFVVGLILSSFASYAWWNCAWKYRIPITIQENSGSTLTDYQVLVTVNTQSLIAAGKMNNDCSDIRFTYYDGFTETEIPYWIESGCGTTSTKIWVKVPSIPASGTATIYMYYGNPTPPSSTLANNPNAVFDFYDDFEDGSIDTSKWTVVGTATETTDPTYGVGVLRGEGGNNRVWVCSIQTFNAPIIVEYRMRPQSTGDFDSGVKVGNLYFISDTGAYGSNPCISTYQCYPSGSQGPDTHFHVYRVTVQSNSQSIRDLTSGGFASASYTYSPGYLCLVGDSDSSSRDTFYDWVRVRKYASVEPSVIVGSEEQPKIISVTVTSPSNETWVSSDIVTINASITLECPIPISCTLQTVYPTSNSFDMVESGSVCTIDLNLNGLVHQDGVLRYKVLATASSSSKQSDEYVLYVDTSHSVSVASPTNNTIVRGQVSIDAASNSILDITSCIVETSLGNFTGSIVGDSSCKANIDLSNDCPDDLWFRVWMINSAGVSSVSDWFHVDNDIIYDLQILQPANASYVTTDTANIKFSYKTSCKTLPTVYIDFLYPSTLTDQMSCVGTSCSYTRDLNYFVQSDGKVEYRIRVVHPNEVQSIVGTFYVPTSHSVTIITPKIGDPVLGSGFHVIAKSDSVLKVDGCIPHLPSGAVAENLKVYPEKRTCEFDVNLENYCSSNTIDISVTMNNTAGVSSTSNIQSHLIYDPPISVKFVNPTPADSESLSLRYLPIKVQVNKVLLGGKYVPSTKKFVYEINGVNYTVYGNDDGYAIKELFHPDITAIIGTKGAGSISFRVYGIGRCSNINATELRTVNIPAMAYKVDFVTPPTPADGDTLTIKFMEIEGKVTDNILANTKCTLEISKDNGYTWIKVKEMDNCYAYLVNNELDTPLGYLLYRINITDVRWGETNLSIIRRININPSAEPIPTVNSGMDLETIQNTIDAAIAGNKPAVLFEPGYYRVNLVIDPHGKLIRLLGANSVLTPASKGYPVIRVLSGDVILERFTIKDALFNIQIESGNVQMKGVKVYGGLYGVEAKNAKLTIEDSVLDNKLTGIKAENIYDSVIRSTTSTGKVWGMIFRNANNVTIDSSVASAKVFGILFDGVSNNNIIKNSSVSAKVFGILINFGSGNIIEGSKINAVVFGIKMPGGNAIRDVTIDGVKVFGIYTTGSNNISNVVIKQAKVFGAYMTGDAYNITIYNSKLGLNLFGAGKIGYLKLGDTLVNITYNGTIMVMEGDPTKHPSGVIYTGQAINKFGNGKLNVTFLYDNPAYKQYYVYNILGGIATLVSSDKNVEANGIGLYALYMSS